MTIHNNKLSLANEKLGLSSIFCDKENTPLFICTLMIICIKFLAFVASKLLVTASVQDIKLTLL